MFVAELRTSRKWLTLIVTIDHTEKGWCPLLPHIMASLQNKMEFSVFLLFLKSFKAVNVEEGHYSLLSSL